jgi:hypothetical protein
MKKQTREAQTDISAAVDAITSRFYTEASAEAEQGYSDATNSNDDYDQTGGDDGLPPALQSYLDFSTAHQGSNAILIGVLSFFVLVLSVWTFLWYHSVQQVDLGNSVEYSLITETTDDFSTMFEDIGASANLAAAQTAEATLKSNLAAAIQKEITAAQTTTSTVTSTTTPNE